jgi:hypothetical protein
VYVSCLEPVPYTGRRRAIFMSQENENELGKASIKAMLRQYPGRVLPPDHKVACSSIASKLSPANPFLSCMLRPCELCAGWGSDWLRRRASSTWIGSSMSSMPTT